jgi:hypothetical protein
MQDSFAHRLARDGAGVNAYATDHFPFLNQRHPLPALGALDGCALSGGSRSDHDEVVLRHENDSLKSIGRVTIQSIARSRSADVKNA